METHSVSARAWGWLCPIPGNQGFPLTRAPMSRESRTSFHCPILALSRWHRGAVPQEHRAGQDLPWQPRLLHTVHPCSTATPGSSCPQDPCAPARCRALHPKQEATVLGRSAAALGIPRFPAGVTMPVTGPDPATPMKIENPTGKRLWAGRGSACPALTPQRWALSLPAGHLFPPEPPERGLGALQLWGSRTGSRGSARTQGHFCRFLLTGCFISRREGGICCSRWYFNGQAGSWSLGEACFTLFGVVTNKFN